jgi:hypothetical protein
VGEFLMSTGILPGAHRQSCPVYAKILKQRPMWQLGRERGTGKREQGTGKREKGKENREQKKRDQE